MDAWFRLRHLQSVSCRDLSISKDELKSSHIFFALSTTDSESLGYFYQSQKSKNLINPDWEDLDNSFSKIKAISYLDNFVLTLFTCRHNKNRILCEVRIHISGLYPVDRKLVPHVSNYQNVYLQFRNSWFCITPPKTISEQPDFDNQQRIKNSKCIYNTETIYKFLRMLQINESNPQTENQSTKYEQLEFEIVKQREQEYKINLKSDRIKALKSHIMNLQKSIQEKKDVLQTISNKARILNAKISRVSTNTEKTEIDNVRHNTQIGRFTNMYDKISTNYMIRLCQLIKELSRVFPITPTLSPRTTDTNLNSQIIRIRSNDKLSICDNPLLISERENQFDQDPSTFGALSMVFRLLTCLSQIYDFPLRYPLIFDGPKLIVRDEIIDLDERNYQLCKHTAATLYKLQYAVYLLNLNISSIRGYFGFNTRYLERTLWNLSTLMEGKVKRPTNLTSPTLNSSQSPQLFDSPVSGNSPASSENHKTHSNIHNDVKVAN